MAVVFEGGRFANTGRTWQANEETAVTGWDKDTIGIYALGIGSTSHNGDTVTPELRWRNVTDAGSWTVLAATGEVKWSTTTALTDDGNLSTGNFGTSSAKTAVTGNGCEQENSGVASSSTALAQNEFTEIQVGISFADGDPGDEYEFAVYDGGSAEGTSVATVTLAAGATAQSVVAVAIGVATVVRKIKKGITATAIGSPSISKKMFQPVTATAIGVPTVSTKSLKTVVVTAIALGVPLVAKKIKKIITATAVPSPSVTRKTFKTVTATVVGVPVVIAAGQFTQSVVSTALGVATSAQNFIAGGVAGKILTKIIGAFGWVGRR